VTNLEVIDVRRDDDASDVTDRSVGRIRRIRDEGGIIRGAHPTRKSATAVFSAESVIEFAIPALHGSLVTTGLSAFFNTSSL